MTQEVINLFQEGLSVSKIAKQLNSYPAKVASILNENGFTTDKRSTIDQVVSVVDAVNEGKTYAEAAKIAGVTFQKVITICKNNGIYKQVKTEVTPELIQKCIEMYTKGISSIKIAEDLGISKWSVLQAIRKLPKKEKSFYNTYSCNYSFFENIDR